MRIYYTKTLKEYEECESKIVPQHQHSSRVPLTYKNSPFVYLGSSKRKFIRENPQLINHTLKRVRPENFKTELTNA